MSDIPWHEKSYKDYLSKAGNKRLLARVEQSIVAQSIELDSHRDTEHIHPSEISKELWCPRSTYYKITDTEVSDPESSRFQRLNIFAEGHNIHDKWQTWMWNAGILIGDWKCILCDHKWWAQSPSRCPMCLEPHIRYAEVPIKDETHRLLGHADGWCRDSEGEYLVELKGLALDTPLPTPAGWTTMGDVSVGDQLIGRDGTPCTVIRKSAERSVPGYRITFDDASTVVCDEDHLWVTLSGSAVKASRDYHTEQILTAKQLAGTLRNRNGQRQHRIMLSAPLDLPECVLPVEPYALGCWLGDGNVGAGSAHLTGCDEIFDELRLSGQSLGNVHYYRDRNCAKVTMRGVITGLKALGLAGVKSPDRWIPGEYLRASYSQRLALLQGLMDSDGTWAKGRERAVFGGVASSRLAENVYELVASLGLRPRITSHLAHGYGKTIVAYYVEFTCNDVTPFRMPSKVLRMGNHPIRTESTRRLIVSMDPLDAVVTQCVQVDSVDSTYLCGRQMVPTHNSVGIGTLRFDAPNLYRAYENKEIDLLELWKRIKRPLSSHNRQIQLYMHCTGVHDAVVIYEWKPNQEVREFAVKYTPEIVEPLLAGCDTLIEALTLRRTPPRHEEATGKSCKVCTYCQFKSKCWSSP